MSAFNREGALFSKPSFSAASGEGTANIYNSEKGKEKGKGKGNIKGEKSISGKVNKQKEKLKVANIPSPLSPYTAKAGFV